MDDEKSKKAAIYIKAGLGEQFAWAIANGTEYEEVMDLWESEWWKQYDDKDALIIAVLNGKLTQEQGKWLNSIRSDHERLALTCVENPDMIEWATAILDTEFNNHPELIEGLLDGGELEVLARIVNMKIDKDLLPPALKNSVELKNPPSHLKPKGPPGGDSSHQPSEDWDCSQCQNNNYSFRSNCNRCEAPRPSSGPPSGPPSGMKKQGIVKWFNFTKGFGFIEQEGSDDLFVHVSEVTGEITDGDIVTFEVSEGPQGPTAVNVSKINKREKACPICSTKNDDPSSPCSACGFSF